MATERIAANRRYLYSLLATLHLRSKWFEHLDQGRTTGLYSTVQSLGLQEARQPMNILQCIQLPTYASTGLQHSTLNKPSTSHSTSSAIPARSSHARVTLEPSTSNACLSNYAPAPHVRPKNKNSKFKIQKNSPIETARATTCRATCKEGGANTGSYERNSHGLFFDG